MWGPVAPMAKEGLSEVDEVSLQRFESEYSSLLASSGRSGGSSRPGKKAREEFSSQFKDAYDSMGKKFHPHGMLRIFVGMSEQYPSAWLCFDTANRETRPRWHCRFVENMHDRFVRLRNFDSDIQLGGIIAPERQEGADSYH